MSVLKTYIALPLEPCIVSTLFPYAYDNVVEMNKVILIYNTISIFRFKHILLSVAREGITV